MAWAPDYATAADLRGYVRIVDTDDDTQLGYAITAASRAIDQTCDRQFGEAAGSRYYTPTWSRSERRWEIEIDDVQNVTGLEIHYDSAGDQSYSEEITSYRMLPINAAAKGRPYTRVAVLPASTVQPDSCEGSVRVTALFGWSSVPTAVVQATLLQASRLIARRDAPFGVAGSPENGSEVRLLSRVDPDVAVSLRAYMKGPRVA
ncbi:hypothetical protein ACL02T_20350 [Pseudonocardia sp. RS010]|uniref:hypothetical protein n=1 Tax=Pseudonocardia sp. RS010 TaxID=3385979 RepID=UPI0039A1DA39